MTASELFTVTVKKMADKYQDHWGDGDDDDDDDEDDFVPGGDDELEDEYVDDDDDDDDDEEEFPSMLEGKLFRDPSKGMNLCFEQGGVFCLVCQDTVPESFQVSSPAVNVPFKFAGWIKSPSTWYEFNVIFSERPETDDPMTLQFLEAQDQLQHGGDEEAGKNNSGGKSTGLEEEEDDDGDFDQKAPAKPSPSLKEPPSYADDGKKAASTAEATDTDEKTGFIFCLSATQVGGDKPLDDDSKNVTFHGSFRRPRVSAEKIFIICPVILSTTTTGAAAPAGAAAASASAAPAAAAAASASAGATSRKRSRTALDDEDDVSCVEEDKGNVLNELIGLHDDAHLTTEQLRAKYYGRDVSDQKKPPPAPMSKKSTDDDDDDDDDDIGF